MHGILIQGKVNKKRKVNTCAQNSESFSKLEYDFFIINNQRCIK